MVNALLPKENTPAEKCGILDNPRELLKEEEEYKQNLTQEIEIAVRLVSFVRNVLNLYRFLFQF